MKKTLVAPLAAACALAAAIGAPATAHATSWIPAPCDFITGGGFVNKDNGHMANFGIHAGCKNGKLWGHVNYVDHETQYHLKSTRITAYLQNSDMPNSRDICGFGRINDQAQEVMFRIRLVDNGEPGRTDTMGINVDNQFTSGERFYRVSSRMLNDGEKGGGNIQLHKGNKSNTIDPAYYQLREWQMCGDLWPSP
jgi:hypothetical protein